LQKNAAARWRLRFQKKRVATRSVGRCQHALALFLQVPNLCTDLDRTLLYILIVGTYSKFVWNIKTLVGVCFSSLPRALTVCLPRQDHVWITTDQMDVSSRTNSMKCPANWNLLRIRVRARNTQPHLTQKNATRNCESVPAASAAAAAACSHTCVCVCVYAYVYECRCNGNKTPLFCS